MKRNLLFPLLLIGAGIVLSLLSATDLCSFNGCTDAHLYRFYGLRFPTVGLVFFGLLLASLLLSRVLPVAGTGFGLILAGGAGAELTMIHLQKDVIQAWCPLCLGIAVVVYLLCIQQLIVYFRNQRRSFAMKKRIVVNALLLVVAVVTGCLVSLNGIAKPAEAGQLDVSMGHHKGPVEVYFFSDWYCPICVRVEPVIETLYPHLLQKARVTFVDKAVHPEAMNFVPYDISFAVHEKGKYMQLRRALFSVAARTRNPTVGDVEAAIAPLKVTYKQLSFMEVTQQMARFQALSNQFQVNATPTMIITNTRTHQTKKLVGGNEITVDGVMKALKAVE